MNKNKSIEISTRLSMCSLVVSLLIFLGTICVPIGEGNQTFQRFALTLLLLSMVIAIAILGLTNLSKEEKLNL